MLGSVRATGKPFHTVGAATLKALHAVTELLAEELGTASLFMVEEQSDLVGWYLWMIEARYEGCCDERILKVSVAILKVILCETGSQCKSARTGVMWSNLCVPDTSRASEF